MQITDSKELSKAISNLNARLVADENNILQSISSIKNTLDPIRNVNKLLPRKVPIGERLNDIIDESITGAADLLTTKIATPSSGSFIKVAGNTILKNSVNMVVNKNAHKIKAIGLAIVKNIF